MKQGESKRLKPKDKHTTASWKKRDEGRKDKQNAHASLRAAVDSLGMPDVQEVP